MTAVETSPPDRAPLADFLELDDDCGFDDAIRQSFQPRINGTIIHNGINSSAAGKQWTPELEFLSGDEEDDFDEPAETPDDTPRVPTLNVQLDYPELAMTARSTAEDSCDLASMDTELDGTLKKIHPKSDAISKTKAK